MTTKPQLHEKDLLSGARPYQPPATHQIVLRPLSSLRINPRNARTHSKKQIRQIANSIKQFGFVGPAIIDENETVLAGHGRLKAAKLLDIHLVPTLQVSGLTDVQKRAFALADNKIGENAGYDREILVQELGELATLLEPLNLDLTITGFEPAEIDALFADVGAEKPDPADTSLSIHDDVVTRPRDQWVLGRHRILCGDARSRADLDRVMDGVRTRMVFTDPPYNVRIADVHLDDLTGFVLRRSDDWTVLSLPAIAENSEIIRLSADQVHHRQPGDVLAPEREPMEILVQLRSQLGSDLFSAQYQQAPVPPGGAMIKRQWIRRYAELPLASRDGFIMQSWDTAAKGGPDNDWSVCTTWLMTEDFQWYLLDVWRGRVDYPALKVKVEELAKEWDAKQVLVEEAGTAIGLLDELRFRVAGITAIKPDKDKVTRMSVASAIFEAGQVHFPERASWLPELEAELFSFPGSTYDDQVNSISQALNHGKSSSLREWILLGS